MDGTGRSVEAHERTAVRRSPCALDSSRVLQELCLGGSWAWAPQAELSGVKHKVNCSASATVMRACPAQLISTLSSSDRHHNMVRAPGLARLLMYGGCAPHVSCMCMQTIHALLSSRPHRRTRAHLAPSAHFMHQTHA
jgi:hypothetical protein